MEIPNIENFDNIIKLLSDTGFGDLANSNMMQMGINPLAGLNQMMAQKALLDLADTNRKLPDVDPFASPYKEQESLGTQILDNTKEAIMKPYTKARVKTNTLLDKLFATGGSVDNKNIEVENNEVIETPGGDLTKVKGKTHKQGGEIVNVPLDSFIFSDKIKIGNDTMSERKLKRERKIDKMKKKVSEDRSDMINKSTLERLLQVSNTQDYYDKRFQNLVKTAITPQDKFGTGGPVNGDDNDGSNDDNNTLDYEKTIKDAGWRLANGQQIPQDFWNGDELLVDKLNAWEQWAYDNKLLERYGNDKIFGNVHSNAWNTGKDDFNKWYETNYGQNQTPSDNTVPTGGYPDDGKNNFDKKLEEENPSNQNPDNTNEENNPGQPNSLENTDKTNSDNSNQNGQGSNKFKNSNLGDFTFGDMIGMTGSFMGMTAPTITTLANRLGDRKNVSFFKQYGDRGLRTNTEQAQNLKALTDEYLKDIDLYSNAQVKRNRQSARTVNVQRALDTVSHMQELKSRESITRDLMQSLNQLMAQRSQLQNMQDKVKMSAEQQADLANRQDRDTFYTNIGQDFNTAATYMQKMGADINKNIQNKMFLQLLPELSEYGIGYNFDPMGNMYSYDENGNIKQLGE